MYSQGAKCLQADCKGLSDCMAAQANLSLSSVHMPEGTLFTCVSFSQTLKDQGPVVQN